VTSANENWEHTASSHKRGIRKGTEKKKPLNHTVNRKKEKTKREKSEELIVRGSKNANTTQVEGSD